MTTLAEPTLHVCVEWHPVGPQAFEATHNGFLLRVEPDEPPRWRWHITHEDSGDIAYGTPVGRSGAMIQALAFAGHRGAKLAAGMA